MAEDASLIAALTLGYIASLIAVSRERQVREAEIHAREVSEREARLALERRNELSVQRRQAAVAGFLVLAAFAVPVAAAFAQFQLDEPGSSAAMPIWIGGLVLGLVLWATARTFAGSGTGRIHSLLGRTWLYVTLGFFLWVVSGTVLNGLSS